MGGLQEALECSGYNPFSYSGRGMFGETCLAFQCDDPIKALAFLIGEAGSLDQAKGIALDFESVRTDSLGMQTVVYFPKLKFEE